MMGEIIDVAFGSGQPEPKVMAVISIIKTGDRVSLIIHENAAESMEELAGLIIDAVAGGKVDVE